MVGFNFAPIGWALCDGSILSISQNSALFALLGTTFGGNGQTTFALPDLRGRAALHQGQGPGLSSRIMGETSGSETVTLLTSEIPSHSHILQANPGDGGDPNPGNNLLAAGTTIYASPPSVIPMNPVAIAPTGGSQPHDNMQPYQVVNFIIALQGIFPSRQ